MKLLNTSHCSPPPSSLSPPQPALFTATIFPISTPTRTLHRHHLPYLHPNPHCSPKFGLYPFFNIFLQNPYLLTWLIWGGEIFGLYRFFNIFLQNPYLLTWLIWGRTFQPCILLTSHTLTHTNAHALTHTHTRARAHTAVAVQVVAVRWVAGAQPCRS